MAAPDFCLTRFFIRNIFLQRMSLKNPKTCENVKENLQPQMPELQFSKKLTFPRILLSYKIE